MFSPECQINGESNPVSWQELFAVSAPFRAKIEPHLNPGDIRAITGMSSWFVQHVPEVSALKCEDLTRFSFVPNATSFRNPGVGRRFGKVLPRAESLKLYGPDSALIVHGRLGNIPPDACFNPYSLRYVETGMLWFGLDVAYDTQSNEFSLHLNIPGSPHLRYYSMGRFPPEEANPLFRRFRFFLVSTLTNLAPHLSRSPRNTVARYTTLMLRDIYRRQP